MFKIIYLINLIVISVQRILKYVSFIQLLKPSPDVRGRKNTEAVP